MNKIEASAALVPVPLTPFTLSKPFCPCSLPHFEVMMPPSTRADPAARTLNIDAATMRVRSVITTVAPDRAGDVVAPTGLKNLDDFMTNPVVFWAHDRVRVPPIGSCEWIDVQPQRIVAETRFAQGVPFAEDLFRLYEHNVLSGWSIGFVPRKTRRAPAPDGSALRFVAEWDLLEYSAVPTPEHPGALTVALQKGLIRDAALRAWLWLVPDDIGGRVVRAFDVTPELIETVAPTIH